MLRVQCVPCWFSSEYGRAGSRPLSDQMAKQVVIATSVTPMDIKDRSPLPDTTYDIPDIVQPTNRRGHQQKDYYPNRKY